MTVDATSLPLVGKWIEIFLHCLNLSLQRSLPLVGKWIEINRAQFELKVIDESSPGGEVD